jgi:predicted DNA-binding protein
MPAKNPRINVVLEQPLYREVQFLAKNDGVSMSTKVRDLLKEVLETQEDIYLARIADRRLESGNEPMWFSHEETWK